MNILYVITGGDIGGAQKNVYMLASRFMEKGHNVHVVVGEEGPFVDILNKSNIPTTIIPIKRTINPLHDFKSVIKLYKFIKSGKFSIVHSHSSKAGIIARITAFLGLVEKNIFTAHGFVFTDPSLSYLKKKIYVLLERVCSWLSTDIITVSRFDHEHGRLSGINGDKLRVVYNGIDEASIISETEHDKKLLDIKERNKKIIGYVGRFAPEKNIDMLLRVAALFENKRNNDVEFWLIGDGPLLDFYKNQAAELGLTNIRFKGHQDQVLNWMDQMDIKIITSHKEGLPFVLLEALSRGVPVVSTDVGGVKEVIGRQGGSIVSINDDQGMYTKLIELLNDNDDYRRKAREAIQTVKSFTTEQLFLETEKIYLNSPLLEMDLKELEGN